MKLISPALLIEALSVRYPDSSMLFAPDVFADFVVEYAAAEGFDLPIVDVLRAQGLSPTGRKPSQPEYQHLRPSTAPMRECSETQPGLPRPFLAYGRFKAKGHPQNLPKKRKQHKAKDDKPYVWPACRPWGHEFEVGKPNCTDCGAPKP